MCPLMGWICFVQISIIDINIDCGHRRECDFVCKKLMLWMFSSKGSKIHEWFIHATEHVYTLLYTLVLKRQIGTSLILSIRLKTSTYGSISKPKQNNHCYKMYTPYCQILSQHWLSRWSMDIVIVIHMITPIKKTKHRTLTGIICSDDSMDIIIFYLEFKCHYVVLCINYCSHAHQCSPTLYLAHVELGCM